MAISVSASTTTTNTKNDIDFSIPISDINEKMKEASFFEGLSKKQIDDISEFQIIEESNLVSNMERLNSKIVSKYQKFSVEFLFDNLKNFNVDGLKDNVYLKDRIESNTAFTYDRFIIDITAAYHIVRFQEVPQNIIDQCEYPELFIECNQALTKIEKSNKLLTDKLNEELKKEQEKAEKGSSTK